MSANISKRQKKNATTATNIRTIKEIDILHCWRETNQETPEEQRASKSILLQYKYGYSCKQNSIDVCLWAWKWSYSKSINNLMLLPMQQLQPPALCSNWSSLTWRSCAESVAEIMMLWSMFIGGSAFGSTLNNGFQSLTLVLCKRRYSYTNHIVI